MPRDITDPLNLKGGGKGGEDGRGVLLSPLKSKRKHRTRHHKVGAGDGEGDKDVAAAPLFPHTGGFRGETPAALLTPGGRAGNCSSSHSKSTGFFQIFIKISGRRSHV